MHQDQSVIILLDLEIRHEQDWCRFKNKQLLMNGGARVFCCV